MRALVPVVSPRWGSPSRGRVHYAVDGEATQCGMKVPAKGWVFPTDDDNNRNVSGFCPRCMEKNRR